MNIKGTEGMTDAEILAEVDRGGKFIVFYYAFSVLIMTFRRSSDVHFIKAGEKTLSKSLPYTLLTLVVGWWGIPWGPIRVFETLGVNLSGGKDVTSSIVRRA
ncbi:MAG: hypothetical protein P8X66_15805 [Maritimibacter sp.]|jgi:hypothetical protein